MNVMDRLVMDYFFGVVFGSVGSAKIAPRQPNTPTPRIDDRGSKG
jgi:hypothetical protein